MGCDIHLHMEVKINGKWHHYGAPSVDRMYALFAKMAGVRNRDSEIKPIAKPRGVPADATELTQFDCARWSSDGHSHSWLDAPEIAQVIEWIKTELGQRGFGNVWDWQSKNFGYVFGNGWDGFNKYPEDRPQGLEDIRWIFWFDN